MHEKKESVNAGEFKICLLENWEAKHVKVKKVRGINVTQCLESSQSLIKNPILNRVYTKFNQTSRSIRRDKRTKNDFVTEITNDAST